MAGIIIFIAAFCTKEVNINKDFNAPVRTREININIGFNAPFFSKYINNVEYRERYLIVLSTGTLQILKKVFLIQG